MTTKSRPTPTGATELTGPASDKPFVWRCKDGIEICLPSLSTLDPDADAAIELAEMMARFGDDNPILSIGTQLRFLTKALGPEAGQALRRIRASEFSDLMEAWAAHSGVAVGESSAS